MDQKKTGSFLKALRTERGFTQEQVAEKFGVAGRTVSRWETGNNMPDLSILIEIAEFYDVDIREIIDGERKSENMNSETKETLEKVADYVDTENEAVFKETISAIVINFTLALTCMIICLLEEVKNVPVPGGVKLCLTGILLMTAIVLLECIVRLKFGKGKTKINETDFCALMSIICGIISIPLIIVYIWIVPAAFGVVLGMVALKNKTEKKTWAVAGILCSVMATLMAVVLPGIGYWV